MISRVIGAGWRMQLRSMRGNPDWFLSVIVAPVQTAVFVTIFTAAGRGDLTSYGVLAPALITLWAMALQTSGELIARERENGSLEGLLAAPGRFDVLIFARIAAVTMLSLPAFAESWAVGWLCTGEPVRIAHPTLFVLTLAITALAMIGWASVMASVFVLARSARTFQNSLSYPFYVLGGVLVPVAYLPDWVRPLSRLVFLSWASDLMRDSVRPEAVDQAVPRLVVVALLGATGVVLGRHLLRRAIRRVRSTGTLAHA